MDIKNYINILWRRKSIIILTVIVTLGIVTVITLKMTPIYSATTTMRIALNATGAVSYQDYMYADRLENTYVKLATTTPVLDELEQKLGISYVPSISVKPVTSTELIQVTVESPDPNLAASASNTLANILIERSSELYTGRGESALEILRQQVSSMEQEVNQARIDYENLVATQSTPAEDISTAEEVLNVKQQLYVSLLEQYEQTRLSESLRTNSITIVDPAGPPEKPSKPNKLLNIGLGFMVGIVGGLGLAFLFENLDTTLYSTEQIEAISKVPIIGKVPRLGKQNSFENMNADFAYGEAFRRLRTNILSTDIPIRTLLITSGQPREGKSRIVANLAFIIAQSGRKVAVIDADLRIPAQNKLFNIENDNGLSSILEQKTQFTNEPRSSVFQGVFIIPSGPLPPNPSELLGSDQMRMLIEKLKNLVDIVLIDSPAALAVADAAILAPMVDAIAIVVCRGKTSKGEVQTVLTQLGKSNGNIIGIIENLAEHVNGYYYYKDKQKMIAPRK